MKRATEVVVVGSYVRDLTWKCAAFPRPGETVLGEFVGGPGGKGSNQAVAAARAGASTGFVGAVGQDAFAAEAKRFYRAEGIAARWIEKPRQPTGTAGILVSAAGENQIVVALGANGALAPRDVDLRRWPRAQVVVCQFESALATVASVLRQARRAGMTTILNPAPMRADFDPAILREVDLLIPNETEFLSLVQRVPAAAVLADDRFRSDSGCLAEALLTPLFATELHRLCRALGVPGVILTLGARGCLVSQPAGWTLLPAHGVPVVDTTGAGDAFVGALAAGYVRSGHDLLAAARFGNAAAALTVTKFGTAPAMPRARAIARLLRA
jgi:ribokinase